MVAETLVVYLLKKSDYMFELFSILVLEWTNLGIWPQEEALYEFKQS